jgi:hypothetical protein
MKGYLELKMKGYCMKEGTMATFFISKIGDCLYYGFFMTNNSIN